MKWFLQTTALRRTPLSLSMLTVFSRSFILISSASLQHSVNVAGDINASPANDEPSQSYTLNEMSRSSVEPHILLLLLPRLSLTDQLETASGRQTDCVCVWNMCFGDCVCVEYVFVVTACVWSVCLW